MIDSKTIQYIEPETRGISSLIFHHQRNIRLTDQQTSRLSDSWTVGLKASLRPHYSLHATLYTLLFTALFLLAFPSLAHAGWLADWPYRKKITIDGVSGAGTDCSIRIYVGESSGSAAEAPITGNDFHLEGKCTDTDWTDKDGVNDIRFTADDGITLLPHWCDWIYEPMQGTGANETVTVWVKLVDIDISTPQDIYIYYGKSGAEHANNPEATFFCYEDFEDGVNDLTVKDGSWAVQAETDGNAGDYVIRHTGGGSSPDANIIYDTELICDVIIRYREKSGNCPGCVWAYTAENNNNHLRSTGGGTVLYDYDAGTLNNRNSSANANYRNNWRWIEVKFNVEGVTAYYSMTDLINNGNFHEHEVIWDDLTATLRTAPGYVGLRDMYDDSNYVDDLIAMKYIASWPGCSAGPEEEPGIADLEITPVTTVVLALTHYSATFTYATEEATPVVFDFSAFSDIDLSECSTTTDIADYSFTGFVVSPTGVTVVNKVITFTGGTLAAGEHTIASADPQISLGWVITNPSSGQTKPVTLSTNSESEPYDLTFYDIPSIDPPLVPDHGGVGTEVTISGTNFGASRIPGFSYVSFNGVEATEYASWSNSVITCTVPAGASAGNVTVTNPAGTSDPVLFGFWTETGGGDHLGEDWVISVDTTIAGTHTNVGTFKIETGVTATVQRGANWDDPDADPDEDPASEPGTPLAIEAENAEILGILDGNYAGYQGGDRYENGFGPDGQVPDGSRGIGGGICHDSWAGGGGGYGGQGGDGYDPTIAFGGDTYGSETEPTDLGSGGGGGNVEISIGGEGGGAIKLDISNTLTITGTISANGEDGTGQQDGNDGGGGSGGSIYIICDTLTGSGSISANGGDATGNGTTMGGGGGGYGRIAIYYAISTYAGSITALGGDANWSGGDAVDGTCYVGAWPDIEFLDPNCGGETDPITINGSGFGTIGTVTFSPSVTAECSEWTDTAITCTVPAGTETGPVIVTLSNPERVSNDDVIFTLGLAVEHVTPVTDVISVFTDYSAGFTPLVGGETWVAFDFSAFDDMNLSACSTTDIENNYAFTGFAQAPNTVQVNNDVITFSGGTLIAGELHEISSKSPGSGGGWVITNTSSAQTNVVTVSTITDSGTYSLTIKPRCPHITSLWPNFGPVGDSVTITGTDFGAAPGPSAYVTFAPTIKATEYTNWTDTVIICKVSEDAETGLITVTTDGGTSNGVSFTVPGGDGPWLDDYAYRKQIPITGVSGAGIDYQVPISVYAGSGAAGPGKVYLDDHCTDFANDIRFTDDDGEALLYHWLEISDANQANFWIKVADNLDDNQTIYIYYGKSDSASASDFDNTFTKDYGESGLAGLWHMDKGLGPTVTDSSGNGNDGSLNTPTWTGFDGGQWDGRSDVIFATGDSLEFDGGVDYVLSTSAINPTALTLSAWVYPITGSEDYAYILGCDADWKWSMTRRSSGALSFYAGDLSPANIEGGNIPLDEWSFVVATWNGSYTKVYINQTCQLKQYLFSPFASYLFYFFVVFDKQIQISYPIVHLLSVGEV